MSTPPQLDQIFNGDVESVSRYVDILIDRGISWGLLGPREADSVWERHVLNSVALRGLIPEGSDVVDVGSGAGLPGVPLALSRPDLRVVLLEPLLRRATFLQGVVDELGLEARVEVVRERAEDHGHTYDAVVSRAVAPLKRLIGWCEPLRREDGQILAIKGASADREVADANRELRKNALDAEVLRVEEPGPVSATVVRLRS